MQNLLYAVFFIPLSFIACSPNNVVEDKSLGKYFDAQKVEGCFGMFDNGQGNFTIYNLPRFRDSAYTPASTFKIVNALVGIQLGRVQDSATVIPWDGINRSNQEWNQDLTMARALRVSSVPWFQELARRIGKDTMQKWLDTLGYGAVTEKGRAVINKIDSFWLDNSVKVTADEQLGLIKRLYFQQLPFHNRTQLIVRNMLVQEDNSNYTMGYKTGLGYTETGHMLGWVVGWIEENRHPYFFVLQVETADKNYDMKNARLALLKQILSNYGFMEGKK